MNRLVFPRLCSMRLVFLLSCICCAAVVLGSGAAPAHGLFAMKVHCETSHGVKPFPIELSVQTDGEEVRSSQIDRDGLVVEVAYSDGSTRQLASDEYDLAPAEIAAGFKGDFSGEAIYEEGGHVVSGGFTLSVRSAYGAQYDDVLVFGRGIPQTSHEDKGLTGVTWGIEEESCSPSWDKGRLTSIIDIDTVRPLSLGGWFDGASSLRTVALEQLDVSALDSLYHVFADDGALASVDLSGWDVSGVANLTEMFANCTSLGSVIGIEGWDTSSVASLRNMFYHCSSLRTLDLSAWDTSSVTVMTGMFNMAWVSNQLTSVGDLSGWDTSKVTDFGALFQNCYRLTSVGDLSRWDTASARGIAAMFQYCHALASVGDISSWDVSNVGSMYNTFQYCSALTSIGDVSRWNTANVTNMFQTFQFDAKLVVDCSKWNVDKVTEHTNFNGNGADRVRAPNWKH